MGLGSLTVRVAGAVALVACVVGFGAGGASASVAHQSGGQALGANVIVLSPSMPQATIQQTLDMIATQQVPNQFGTQRYAILFEPGTYGSAADPLDFQVGYYTQVAGLGAEPADVVINGAIDVFNQCSGSGTGRTCTGLTMWAVSQAAPMRRVIINGLTTLTDYCNANPFVSGGFLADDEFQARTDDPTLVQEVFFRVGGAEAGQATDSLVVNTDDTILDDVSAYGLFVEHYQKFEVIWNGQNGEDVFFQNEMPCDPPSQSSWMSSPITDGYAAFLVTPRVHSFHGYGMGSYSFFN